MKPRFHFPYGMREDGLGTWEVYEILNGEVATLNDEPLTMLPIEEAKDAVEILNKHYLARREGTTH